jgi:hypothetical protein
MQLKLVLITVVALLMFSTEAPCAQQPATATLSGRVIDPNGAAVGGTNVAITHKATSIQRETTT